jgi:hypothetical protein
MGSGRLGLLHIRQSINRKDKSIKRNPAACCVPFVIAWGDVLLFPGCDSNGYIKLISRAIGWVHLWVQIRIACVRVCDGRCIKQRTYMTGSRKSTATVQLCNEYSCTFGAAQGRSIFCCGIHTDGGLCQNVETDNRTQVFNTYMPKVSTLASATTHAAVWIRIRIGCVQSIGRA